MAAKDETKDAETPETAPAAKKAPAKKAPAAKKAPEAVTLSKDGRSITTTDVSKVVDLEFNGWTRTKKG